MSARNHALERLSEKLIANGVKSSARAIAEAVIDLACAENWVKRPELMSEWLEQLAIAITKNND